MTGLTHTRIKTMRAEEHMYELYSEICLFLFRKPITVTKQDDVEKGIHIVRFEVKPIPNSIPLLIGEWAYNLRSGLDQLAWQLALLSGRTPHKSTAFPIHWDRSRETLFRNRTRDIPTEAVTTIESLQPYNRGDGFSRDPLWKLNEICNLDKHATMPVSFTHLAVKAIPGDSRVPVDRVDRDNGAELHVPIADKSDIDFEPSEFDLVFGRPINEPGSIDLRFMYGDITDIHEFVRDSVIPRFERFFRQSDGGC